MAITVGQEFREQWYAVNVSARIISLGDLPNLPSFDPGDAFRMRCDAIDGTKPRYYIDQIQIEEVTATAEYAIEPDGGTWLYISHLTISIADAYAGTVTDGTMPSLPYDSLLGETLVSGLNYQRIQDGVIEFSVTLTNLMDLMQFPGATISGSGSDGTNTWVTINIPFIEPFLLKPERGDKLKFTISEDLTGLLFLRATAGCREEERS